MRSLCQLNINNTPHRSSYNTIVINGAIFGHGIPLKKLTWQGARDESVSLVPSDTGSSRKLPNRFFSMIFYDNFFALLIAASVYVTKSSRLRVHSSVLYRRFGWINSL